MPFPIAIAGLGGIGGLLQNPLGKLGISEQRLRSPAANRRARVKQIADAEAMVRGGDEFGVKLLLAWSGLGRRVSRADYKGGVEQGGMPSDGRTGSLAALDRLKSDGLVTAGNRLAAAGKRGDGTKRSKAASQGTGARKGTTTRGGPRERTYVRYDPDTGERVTVTRDDPRYDEWSNRRPRARSSRGAARVTGGRSTSRRKTRTQRETDAAIRQVTREATKAGLELTASAAKWFVGAAAAAGMSVTAAAALVVGTGLASYAATRWLINKIEDVTDPAYKREQVALAYRRARQEWERQAGRKLTKLEHDFLARNFKDALKALDAGVTYNP